MNAPSRSHGTRILFILGLAFLSLGVTVLVTACGGGGDDDGGSENGQPLSVDYSTLRVAESRERPLQYARNTEEILKPLRNGVRLMLGGGGSGPVGIAFDTSTTLTASHSNTTIQIEGIDEADAVKYDGRHIFAARPEAVPASSTSPQWSRNVLDIARTNAATGTVEPVSKFVIEGEQSTTPLLYQLAGADGRAEEIVAVSQNFRGWLLPQPIIAALVVQPDRTTIQLLDVRDPAHVSQTWKLEMDGWLRASRMIGDTLYLVSSYRPRVADLILPADTQEKREANERKILSTSSRELMPQYWENGGTPRPLTVYDGCLIAQQTDSSDAYTDLLVISAINLRTRRVTDVNCLSTNVGGVYMSTDSLYIAGTGTGSRDSDAAPMTVLHKFAVREGDVSYRATGAVVGTVGWSNPSYFMDEHEGDLRILTSQNNVHRLTVLRESGPNLMLVSSIPNSQRPAPIGKPGEQVYAVRFMGERAYVVTFRMTDPLYVMDLRDPANPAIAGQLEIPGFSTYLRPLGATQSEYLLAVGQDVTGNLRREGLKVELFDVRDIANPRSLGVQVIGKAGTSSEALSNPHALSFLAKTTPGSGLRLAIPVQVHDTPRANDATRFDWTYTGLHLLEVTGVETEAPQLRFQGVIKTDQPTPSMPSPRYATPERGVLHDDAVFAIHGDRFLSGLWQNLPPS
jgi:hypothetical protein